MKITWETVITAIAIVFILNRCTGYQEVASVSSTGAIAQFKFYPTDSTFFFVFQDSKFKVLHVDEEKSRLPVLH